MKRRADRETRILTHLRQGHYAAVAELARLFSVSEETIRRDLKRLETEGLVEKVHGGVMLTEYVGEPPFRSRMELNQDAKHAIGRRAAELVPENATLFLDGGTTVCAASRFLRAVNDLTVVTPSIEVARTLIEGRIRVLLAPGALDRNDCCVYGPETADYIGGYSYGWALFSASALHPTHGCSDFKREEAMQKRRASVRAERRMILADATKFGRSGFVEFCALDEIDLLVTDAPPPKDIADAIPGSIVLA